MEDYEEFGLGGEEGEEGEERRGVLFLVFGFVKWVGILGGKILPGRCYAKYIYIYMDGRYALVCSALYIPCTRERTR